MPAVRAPRWIDWAERVLIAAGVVAYLVLPHGIGADGTARWETTQQLRQGHISSARYAIIQSVLALPLHVAGEVIGYPFGMVALFNTLVFLAGLGGLAVLLWRQIPEPLLRRMLLLLLAASMFGHHVQLFYGEVMTAVFVAVGLLCFARGYAVAGHLLVIVGVLNTPAALPAMFMALLSRQVPRRLLLALWPTVLTAALIMIEFDVRRGSPFLTGYEGDGVYPPSILPYAGRGGFSYPFVFGVLGILFSFGKGIAVFVPGLWLLLTRPVVPPPDVVRRFQRMAIWFLVGLVAAYAKWWSWNGSWFWGPRFFLFACVPGAVALAIHLCDLRASTRMKALTLAVLCWSIWVGVNGVAIGLSGLETCQANSYQLEFLCWYSVELSALFRPFTVFPPIGNREGIVAVYFVMVGLALATPFALELIRAGIGQLRLFAASAALATNEPPEGSRSQST